MFACTTSHIQKKQREKCDWQRGLRSGDYCLKKALYCDFLRLVQLQDHSQPNLGAAIPLLKLFSENTQRKNKGYRQNIEKGLLKKRENQTPILPNGERPMMYGQEGNKAKLQKENSQKLKKGKNIPYKEGLPKAQKYRVYLFKNGMDLPRQKKNVYAGVQTIKRGGALFLQEIDSCANYAGIPLAKGIVSSFTPTISSLKNNIQNYVLRFQMALLFAYLATKKYIRIKLSKPVGVGY